MGGAFVAAAIGPHPARVGIDYSVSVGGVTRYYRLSNITPREEKDRWRKAEKQPRMNTDGTKMKGGEFDSETLCMMGTNHKDKRHEKNEVQKTRRDTEEGGGEVRALKLVWRPTELNEPN